eukprot:TRINITY_DN5425_c0_g2_i2.p1 TRINITY_DN5425_c0_g2~~TRINITY_DN5425_c0_g2_i2.p1  ORF type:complete len:622 (-),score=162.84 TRINITY_DN5425_c0_g2_i2:178-2043(-)
MSENSTSSDATNVSSRGLSDSETPFDLEHDSETQFVLEDCTPSTPTTPRVSSLLPYRRTHRAARLINHDSDDDTIDETETADDSPLQSDSECTEEHPSDTFALLSELTAASPPPPNPLRLLDGPSSVGRSKDRSKGRSSVRARSPSPGKGGNGRPGLQAPREQYGTFASERDAKADRDPPSRSSLEAPASPTSRAILGLPELVRRSSASARQTWRRLREGLPRLCRASSQPRPRLETDALLSPRTSESESSDDNGLYNVDLPHFQDLKTPSFVENFAGSGRPFAPGVLCVDYAVDRVVIAPLRSRADCTERAAWVSVRWIVVPKLRDAVDVVHELGAAFGLHPLSVEDALTVPQRTKLVDFDEYLYLVCRALIFRDGDSADKLATEQVSIFLFANMVISIFEGQQEDSTWPLVLELLERYSHGKLRTRGSSFLCYSLLRQFVTAFTHVTDKYFVEASQLQQLVMQSSSYDVVTRSLHLVRELDLMRQLLRPLRDLLTSFRFAKNRALVRRETTVYVQDSLNDLAHVVDVIETYKEYALALRDQSLNAVRLKTNNITWFLLIVTVLFVPNTIIASIFSFNFEDPVGGPSSHVPYGFGYPLFFVLTMTIMMSTLAILRHKQFL